tara:strand:- start:258 stop:488 length:231 start_codon:yes stop_codon:yes gene_type:complete
MNNNMLIQEFIEEENNVNTETRVYIDKTTSEVVLYQYLFKEDVIISTSCVRMPMKIFGKLTHDILKFYLAKKLVSL